MVVLQALALVTGFGLVLFVAGLVLGRSDLAMMGSIVVIGIGATAAIGGMEYDTGETTETQTITSDVPDLDFSNVSLVATKDVGENTMSPQGLDWASNGNHLYSISASSDEVTRYDSTQYDLALATYESSLDVSANVTDPTGIEVENDGAEMYVTNNGNANEVVRYTMSEPNNISTASVNGSLAVGQWAEDPHLTDFSSDGTKMFLVDADGASIESFELADPWDITTATHVRSYDISSQEPTPTAMAFERNGERMVILGTGTDTVYSYSLDDGYNLSTASYTGNSIDVGGAYGVNVPSAVSYEENGRSLFVADSQQSEFLQLNTEETVTEQLTTTNTTYEEVGSVGGFPLDFMPLIVGLVMLLASIDRAGRQLR